ncbi:MAG: ferredoxin [Candidatus Raymondbacteria bacterium RifOxyC12_full_50_8]|uniref:Ferredoxin n=1 Tax=Candidatus Raymondbacteria bacterium RIFOXYD12_FULL_49_13 TaxID=1817890 RepID=A0A1F7F9W0_UNCRA|nr:MAG: ferredoxin [Candidatus Raymondbacteria bacterium RIFOXYA2_FULL_49_16]OGJ99432.1 MAG: ferredoxin [Candidatus Raymondbacteria bacterium RifOxyC12_full_50_8]OGK03296.1 MAG: ferredoxin [Candidatus Raymondbacteria bacterium RIFOXYD12_FULL_49_13]OGP44935.1 MAG: ferredoxin [Candidatus Raymondbacteria bacterium RIFOXYB2_FULL_49_35]
MKLTINAISVEVPEGTTILAAAAQAGIKIPTLCHLEGVQSIGACRVCLVEVEGAKTLVASCVMPVMEGMKVYTNTKRVREARRMVVEMLLSEHDGNCQTCNRNNDCELQSVAFDLGITDITYQGVKGRNEVDASTPALVRDNGKCIKCRRCVTVCTQVQAVGALFPQFRGFKTVIGPAFNSDLADVSCVQCGQCAAVCPVGAIVENSHIERVWAAIEHPSKTVVVQTAPAVRAALGECFGNPPGTLVTGKMVAALRRMGFDVIFDTNFTADLTIIEEGMELLKRLTTAVRDKQPVALPQFTSCSPGWIKFAETYYPEFIPNLSTCKSPQQMFGAIAKTYWAKKAGKDPKNVYVVSIMPCVAKKFEAQRPEMDDSGFVDIDAVLTTRELGRMIRQAGIDFNALPDEDYDRILGTSTGAADIFANTGGVMEAALRTAYEVITGRNLPFEELHVTPLAGLEGIKKAAMTITGTLPEYSFLEGVVLKVAVVHALGNAKRIIEEIKNGEIYHFVEVMTCPGGCIGGGGQPRLTDNEKRKKRIEAIYKEDEGKKLRKSHDNPKIKQIYGEFLNMPLGKTSHHLLHTEYIKRERV